MSRIAYVDISKGIVISLMVIGHTSIPTWLSNWIWSFHMPFFFFISGMTTNWDNKTFWPFFKNKIPTLVLPFFLYSIINLLCIPLYSLGNCAEWGMQIRDIAFNGWGGIALWFLPVFWFAIIISKTIPKKHLSLFAFIFAIIGSILCHYHIVLPWAISSIPIAIVYFLMGRLISVHGSFGNFIQNLPNTSKFLIAGICLTLNILISQNFRLDIAFNQINPILILFIGAITGISAILFMSQWIKPHLFLGKTFSYLGRNTLEIMSLSQCIILIINSHFHIMPLLKYIILGFILYLFILLKQAIYRRIGLAK